MLLNVFHDKPLFSVLFNFSSLVQVVVYFFIKDLIKNNPVISGTLLENLFF